MHKKIHIGLAQWHHSHWYSSNSSVSAGLSQYSRYFSSIEGNASFYALPSSANLKKWHDSTPSYFKFCFKFPQEISHKQGLIHCSRLVCDFLNRISPLNDKLGIIWLQLDAHFAAKDLYRLAAFLKDLPTEFNYGVEVRHLDFFRKGDVERKFNQILKAYHVNRVIFDTRSLFACEQKDAVLDVPTREALAAKPRVPTHVINTGSHPFVRVIVPMDIELGRWVLMQWVEKVVFWLNQGLLPYLFFHTPDNVRAPHLAIEFTKLLNARLPDIEPLPEWPGGTQGDLF